MPAPSNALTMINLCNISYDTASRIAGNVRSYNPNLQVVWGPVEYTPPDAYESVSLIYIVKGNIVSQSNNEYTVVIRGTNFESWDSWEREDFDIATTVKFNTIVPTAPDAALIAKGTHTGMGYLLHHSNDGNGISPHVFLKRLGSNVKYLNVTGHSLGGTLTPPYFAFLCDYLFPGAFVPLNNCQPFSFAGLTPGNDAFNRFFLAYLQRNLKWRYVNPLDIAPNCWWSLSNIQNIYVPYESWRRPLMYYGLPESALFNRLFGEAAPNNYVQPSGEYRLPTAFHDKLEYLTWALQAMYQHHSTTYIALLTPATAAPEKDSKPAKKVVVKKTKKKSTGGGAAPKKAVKPAPAKKKTKPAATPKKKKKSPAKAKPVKKSAKAAVKKVLLKKATPKKSTTGGAKKTKKAAVKRKLVKKSVKKVLQKKAAPKRKPSATGGKKATRSGAKKGAPKKSVKGKTKRAGGRKK